jgi:4-carboxymuconolactone decarboxylase
MARIGYPDPARLGERTRDLLDKLRQANVFRVLAHAEPALRPLVQLGSALLYEGQLDARLRELVIVRVGHLCGSAYEVYQHEQFAASVGVPAEKIAAVREGPRAAVFTPLEACVLRFADESVRDGRASDGVFAMVQAALGDRQTVELTVTVGYYLMMARVLVGLDVDLDNEAKLSAAPLGAAA